MKGNHRWMAVVLLLALSCKKEIKQSVPSDQTSNNIVPCGNTWVHLPDFSFKAANPIMVYNNKAYFFSYIPGQAKQVAIFDGTNWEVIDSDIPIESISGNNNFSFVIGNRGYVGRSQYPGSHPLYRYLFDTNQWDKLEDFPGPERGGVAVFTIGNDGYIAGGKTTVNPLVYFSQLWRYNTLTDTWTEEEGFLASARRAAATGFGINGAGYVATGAYNTVLYKTMMKYNPAAINPWTNAATFPGAGRSGAVNFVINGKAYVGAGASAEGHHIDFYKYDPAIDEWTRIADAPSGQGYISKAFSLNGKGYVVRVPEPGIIRMDKYIPPFCFTGVSSASNP